MLLKTLSNTLKKPLLEQAIKLTEQANIEFLSKLSLPKSQQLVSLPSLCVIQGEKALFKVNRELIRFIGSEDATTCVIVVLIGNGYCYVSHVDDSTSDESCKDAIKLCTNDGKEQAKLYLAGGYEGDSPERILELFFKEDISSNIFLNLCCCGDINREINGFPKTRSLIIDLLTETPLPFTFINRGPELNRRHAARSCSTSGNLITVTDLEGNLHFPSFKMNLHSSSELFFKEMFRLAQESPKEFLKNFSTSPEHESDFFIPDMMGMLDFVLKCKGKKIEESFYVLQDNDWVKKDISM